MSYNEDIFNAATTLLFDDLLKSFPMPVFCVPSELSKKVDEVIGRTDDQVITATENWLSINGFIRSVAQAQRTIQLQGTTTIGFFHQYVLTDKSLMLLKRMPSSLEQTKNKIEEAINETKGEVRRQAIATVVSEILGGAVRGLVNSF